ncbi:BGTF surface domain-containing protein [Halobellus captivus]|uniref:BGTF surface domain-containing protein n=1 Tax=Halobellus captivus TaxID=2592614 RepID=UPI00119FBEBA|nr:BGTF surface domain-containing protein [Halobellus captivus]
MIEIPFSEDVSKAGGESGALTLSENITVLVDGADVTSRYVLDADGADDGQVVLSSSTAIDPRSAVHVEIDAVNDSLDTETIEPGAVEVINAGATVSEDEGSANVYEGEVIAFVANDGSADRQQSFEVEEESGAFVFAGDTGAGSQVFTFDTDARNWSEGYVFTTLLDDGTADETVDTTLRALDLTVNTDDRTVTTADSIEVSISANSGGRVVEATLLDARTAVLTRQNITLDGNGATPFAFDESTLAAAGPGNYTVAVTDAGTGETNESIPVHVVDADETAASLRTATVEEHAGDVVEFGVDLRYTDTATVTVGSPDSGFRANVTVADENRDGTVDVWFNTAAAVGAETLPDDGGDVFGVGTPSEGGDDAVLAADVDGGGLAASIEPDEYALAVRPGDDPAVPAQHTGVVAIERATPSEVRNWVAPMGTDVSTRGDLAAAVDSGQLTTATEIAVGDVVVHRIVLPGIAGAFTGQEGTPTEAFFALAGSDADARFALTLTRRASTANQEARQHALTEENATVVADPANDTYVVAYEGGSVAGFDAGESVNASIEVNETGAYGGLDAEDRTLTTEYALVDAAIDAVGPIRVANTTNQSITGTTTAAPGTELELRIRSANGTEPKFLKTANAVVDSDGRWVAEVDFGAQRVGDEFIVTSAVDVIPAVDELLVDGVVRAVAPSVSVESVARTTDAGGGDEGGQGGPSGSADAGGASDRDTGEPSTTPGKTADSDESVIDSTKRFVGGVLGTFVDESGDESLRSRLLGFDVLVSLGALTAVTLFVARRAG